MATLTVRNLDEALVRALKIRAAENGRSAEAEARVILADTLADRRPDLTLLARRRDARSGEESFGDAVEVIRKGRKRQAPGLAGS